MKRNEQNDFEFIKDKFEKTYPATPDSLSEDAINQLLLSKQEPKVIKLKPRYNVKAIVNAAAGLLLFLGIMYAAYISGISSGNNEQIGNFENYNEVNINSTFSDNEENKGNFDDYSAICGRIDSLIDSLGWYPLERGAGDFSVQFSDIDENVQKPDQIKTDGEYVYYLYNHTRYDDNGKEERQNKVYIFKANKSKTELVSVINYEADSDGDDHSNSFYARMSDLYIYNDRLVVEIWVDDPDLAYEYNRDFNKTVVQVYDISDKSAPKLISEFEQSGTKVSSQMIDNYLYTVSYYYAPEETGIYTIPVCGNLNKAVLIPVQNISVFEDSYVYNYIVVNAIDVETAEKVTDSKAVLGAAEDVFFSGNALYVTDYTSDFVFIKAKLNAGNIEFSDEVRFNEDFNYGVKLVEANGSLFILNYVYANILILNENLEAISKVEGFAENEEIRAVRFVGNMLYLVTYNGDYTFKTIDISNPQNPTLCETVALDKTIREMISINDEYLFCFGETDGYESEVITLVDISDKSNPKILDTIEFYEDLRLDIFNRFVVNSEKGYIAIPCSDYSKDTPQYGVMAVEVVNGKIKITNQFENENISDNGRWLNIGDYLYCYTVNDESPIENALTIYLYKY